MLTLVAALAARPRGRPRLREPRAPGGRPQRERLRPDGPAAHAGGAGRDERGRRPARRVLPLRSRAARPARDPLGAGAGGRPGRARRAPGAASALDVMLEPGERRLFPLPIVAATGVILVSSLSEAEADPGGTPGGRRPRAARLHRPRARDDACARASTPRSGRCDRPDVRGRAAHGKATDRRELARARGRLPGPPVRGGPRLPGRYYVDGLSRGAAAGHGRAPRRPPDGGGRGARGATSAGLGRRLRERHAPPASSARRRRRCASSRRRRAWPRAWSSACASCPPTPPSLDALGVGHPPRDRSAARGAGHRGRRRRGRRCRGRPGEPGGGRAVGARARSTSGPRGRACWWSRSAWDPGWSASVDGRPLPLLRVNHAEIGVPLGPGHPPRGPPPSRTRACPPACALAALAAACWRARSASRVAAEGRGGLTLLRSAC